MTSDPDIFIAPCSRDNNKSAIRYLRDTVLDGISPEEYPEIKEIRYSQKTPVWGVVESKRSTWKHMRDGVDLVLFYSKSGCYTHLAVIEKTYENADLASKVWAPYDGSGVTTDPDDPWSLMFFLSNVTKVDIPSDAVHDAFGYEMNYPLGFMRPTDERHAECRSKYGSIIEFLNEVSTQDQPSNSSTPDTVLSQLVDRYTRSVRRKRSGVQKKISKKKSNAVPFEQDTEEIQENTHRHESILDIFEEKLNKKGFDVFETVYSDLIGIRDDELILGEAKTINNNEDKQIRQAIGQLYEYRYRDILLDDELDNDPLMCLILDQKPSSFYFEFLSSLETEGIYFYWVDDGEVMNQNKSKAMLDSL